MIALALLFIVIIGLLSVIVWLLQKILRCTALCIPPKATRLQSCKAV